MASGKTLFKYGCFGCLGIIVLMVGSLAAAIGIARMQGGTVEMAEQALRPEIPSPSFDLPQAVGTIELDLSGGEFHIKPAAEGESLHVEAVYDKAVYAFEESLTTDDGEAWVYRVTFRQTRSGLMSFLRQTVNKVESRIDVHLPTDRPMALDLRLSKGVAEVELGGLWITEADVDMQMGELMLAVSEPMQAPMNRLSASASMAGFGLSRLGNASPRLLAIDAQMGGVGLDLRGKWVADSDVSIRCSVGGGSLRLPDDVRFEGLDRPGVALPEEGEVPLPVLKFDIRGDTENLDIRYP